MTERPEARAALAPRGPVLRPTKRDGLRQALNPGHIVGLVARLTNGQPAPNFGKVGIERVTGDGQKTGGVRVERSRGDRATGQKGMTVVGCRQQTKRTGAAASANLVPH